MDKPSLWPEGETFILEVIVPYPQEPFPIVVTFNVPAFEVVVELWKNKDPQKTYELFRQFISDWNQEEKLSDELLIGYLVSFPGTDEAMMSVWAEHMRTRLADCQKQYSTPLSLSIN
ncbi:hypothetical protein JHE03_08295 [Pluralibacter gergoviae]|uniref:hypothetical protein n=1 Tax=Pluralibacter gergoviae TaxID=61647 RepID=UPI001909DFEE|nr:hypothetical protein [Pluralibacter gergoviae]ELC3076217.1 hypothetical protein [Pluralibacter gergoviae]MBK4116297.1 hypothetical protein [Pluralibacter gergoviae]